MNTHAVLRAYARPEAPIRTPRALEYDVIAQVTQRLSAATARKPEDFPALARALDDNLRLWSVLAADVAEEGNPLPRALRARLFYLYEFTATHTRRVLAREGSAQVLVEINTAVLRGLRGEGGAS
jgi:flagellar protein FlaF